MTISEETLRQFIGGLERSAAAQERAASTSERIAEAVERSTEASEQRQAAIIESLNEGHVQREKSVEKIEKRIDSADEKAAAREAERERWWRMGFVILGLATAVGAALGVPIGRILSAVLGLKP